MKNAVKQQTGQVLPLTIFIVGLVLLNSIVLIGNATTFFSSSHYQVQSDEAENLAEAGVDKALASFNKDPNGYLGETETPLGAGSYSVSVINIDNQTKQLKVTGYVPSKTSPKSQKTITINLSKGSGASFNYGMQIGEGGLMMGNGATLNGSIYSNGNISAGNLNTITGDVWVAGGTEPSADQQSDCITPNCQDFTFGTNVGGENVLDVAQSFQPTSSGALNKVSLKLRKIGSPPDELVKILGDNNGIPNKNNILATGTLSSNLVTNQYGFIDVDFSTAPNLSSGSTYWIMVITSSDSNNYWAWSNDTSSGYLNGDPQWSANWSASHPVWTAIIGDLGFKTYMGGVATSASFGSGSAVNGDLHAHNISGVTIGNDAYYQSISNSIVKGRSYPNSADPPPTSLPISDANISDWKSQAQSFGVISNGASYNAGSPTLGPGKVDGDLTLGNGVTLTVKTPLWITGDVDVGNSSAIKLDSSLGSSSGIVIVDGTTSFGNGDNLLGSGTAGSYLVYISTYNSETQGQIAVNSGNSSFSGVIYAPYGIFNFGNGAGVKEISAWKIELGNSAILNYDTGLASLFFSSGPSGSYALVKGTYQIK